MTLLWIIAAVLLVVVLARLMTVVNLASEITKEDNDDTQIKHNTYNGIGFVIFMVAGLGLMLYMTIRYSKYMLPEAASAHGPDLDFLLNVNFLIIGIVFFITQIVLFWFAHKYRHNHSRRAYFYPENHKLELVWTVVPAIVLTVLIVTGLKQWNDILMTEKKGMNMQVYAYQFAFIARYAGEDNTLGKSNFRLINDDNALGLNLDDKATKDDIITSGNEMRLPVGTSINFTFNARDVLHGAYMPHFRAQMNMVPGMNTVFNFTPTITTAEMRKKLGKEDFDYVLLCNKICGNAHYTMKMKIVVDTPEEFASWLKTQKKATDIPVANVSTVNTIASAPDEKTENVSDVVSKLSTGFELLNPSKSGVESKLIAFIEDKSKMVDKTTWFSFDRLLFETGKTTLVPSSQEQLTNIAEILKAYPAVELKLGGYTDNVGNPENNQKLSDGRAKAVMAELVKLGIDSKRLAAEGYGEQFPVASNDTEDGRKQNRRIDLRVTKK